MKFDPKTTINDMHGTALLDNLLTPIKMGEQIANGILTSPVKQGESAIKKMRLAMKLAGDVAVDISDEEKSIIDDIVHNGNYTVLLVAQVEETFGLGTGK